jgi:hypothetical protein
MELAHATLLTPRILKCLQFFRKKYAPLSIIIITIIISCYCYDENTLPVSVRGLNVNSDGYENRRISELVLKELHIA